MCCDLCDIYYSCEEAQEGSGACCATCGELEDCRGEAGAIRPEQDIGGSLRGSVGSDDDVYDDDDDELDDDEFDDDDDELDDDEFDDDDDEFDDDEYEYEEERLKGTYH